MEIRPLEIQGVQFQVGDIDDGGIQAGVQFGPDLQAGGGARVSDQLDDDLVADQGPPAPVLGNMGEHTMLVLFHLLMPGGK